MSGTRATNTIKPLPMFPASAREKLADTQLRRNLNKATHTIRAKRALVVQEMPDWQELRDAGRAIKEQTMQHLDLYLVQLETSVQQAGGIVHWARDADEANAIIVQLVEKHKTKEIIKVKSLTTDEIGLNRALEAHGIQAVETDLAELIIQLAGESSSHILVPAIHKNRSEIRELFMRSLHIEQLSDDPKDLANAARKYLRQKFLSTPVAVSGANFAVAATGTVCVVESEGNGRMCLTLPQVLISVMGIEKVIPSWNDLAVFLQLLPRSATGERMNPYTSLWTGVSKDDGPQEFHLILLDNGRTRVLAAPTRRQTLHCIRCSACLNICPVYERVGGHAYNSVYPGPIGAILTPQLVGISRAGSLPFASSLCGACYDVCPVKINIPAILLELRGQVVRQKQQKKLRSFINLENIAMRMILFMFAHRWLYVLAQRTARIGQRPFQHNGVIDSLPGALAGWSAMRDLPAVPRQSFRQWWRKHQKGRAS